MTPEALPAVSINYHFVRDASPGRFRLRAHERADRFDGQVARLARRFSFLRGREVFDAPFDAAAPVVALTFDDGAVDVFQHALPALARHGATATAFVCTRPYLEGRLLQIQQVEYLMAKLGLDRFRAAFYEELERQFPGELERESLDFADGYRFYRYDDEPIRRFKLDLNYQLPYRIVEPVLEALFVAAFGEGSEAEAVRETYLSLDELKRLRDAGVEIGTHSHSHRVLPRLGADEQREELETSAAFLREATGADALGVAYPFGFYDERTVAAAEAAGLYGGFVGQRRFIEARDVAGRWAVPRYDVVDCFDRATNEFAGDLAKAVGGPA